ncbi:MAG: SGNH/GDSL hydrolase family protein [Candidatus Aminicenantales bacterium]
MKGGGLPGFVCLGLAVLMLAACSSRPRNFIILCAGDSLTEQGYPSHLEKLLAQSGVRARVRNYGRSGFTSGEYLRFLEGRRTSLEAEQPDFVLLQLGTNDVRLDGDHTPAEAFENNMRRIIGIFSDFRTRWGRRPLILLASIPPVPEEIGFPFSPESSARVREEINPFLNRLSAELRLPLIDNFVLFRDRPGLLRDVHPTEEGYQRIAANWYAGLKPFLKY